jgi:hypothetical protein
VVMVIGPLVLASIIKGPRRDAALRPPRRERRPES